MKKIIISLVMVFSFVAISTAQEKAEKVVKKEITKEVKQCAADCTKPCCADKNSEKHAECKGDKHEHGKKSKECCAAKEDGKECAADCTKPCCADKKTEVIKEVIKVKETAKMTFACPMKCEGDKAYSKEGSCPKCKMDLKPTKTK
ncbi:heavy metal-binding domain-containing protein [Lutibacter sp.]|uniref:heavy metal-binding domain-containing protein n=1 Tax=Lutibacter sp. TaxID=1925666 RepID=UPI002732ADFA|nr:heavy metal-binding domain-containing protein [Lutibacter sp.]MDP3312017.1 heavy metal-binding domain-containing protein [Lutibacter sp.]